MTKLLLFALLGLAARAAWACSRGRQCGRKPASNASQSMGAPDPVEAEPVRPPDVGPVPPKRVDAGSAAATPPSLGCVPPASDPTASGQQAGTLPARIAPERRGGGQMETEKSEQPTEQRKRVRSGPQLRLVCFKDNDRMWRVAVELPEDFSAGGDIVVSQDGQTLQPVRYGENRWPLKCLTGLVEGVEARNGGQGWQLEIGDNKCWLFKLLAESETEEGCQVSAATRGDYLLVMPDNWKKSLCSGIELRREYNLDLAGYVGCRWSVFQVVHARLEFLKRDGERVVIPFRAACFTLSGKSGNAVFAKNEAPLFLCSPPRVRALAPNAWPDVEKVVLRLAGEGHGNLVACFPAMALNNEVELSEHLKKSKGGWYDVRLYDANGLLMDSLYFAFAKTLRGIKIPGAAALPSATGHGEARIEFEHDAEATVEAFFGNQKLEGRSVADGVAYTVPSCCERVDWQISWPGGSPMKCITRLERVWWALGSEGVPPVAGEWADRRVTAKRQDFRASSPRALWILLPWPGWITEIRAGFEHSTSRSYPTSTSSNKREVAIPLREFCDAHQVVSLGRLALSIWLGTSAVETAIVIETSVTSQCKFCDVAVNSEQDAVAHFSEHWEKFITEAPHNSNASAERRRPFAAFKCETCGKVVYAWHDTDFREISRHATRHSVRAKFTPIDLPVTGICRCGFEVKRLSEEQFIAHLRDSHTLGELFNRV